MRLSDLKTGETGVIVKVLGHGSFRKRIVEMGFVAGQRVESLLNAPLHDPVKYRIMGYEVSLRHAEAAMVEIIASEEMAATNAVDTQLEVIENRDFNENLPQRDAVEQEALRRHRIINVALVGNPNCGKTSLFNFVSGANERVGNYSGVTVEAKEGEAQLDGYTFKLVDLPGTYSLSAYSPEELYVRKQLVEQTPDVVVNVIDASNLERNLYLTTQLIDMNLRVVCALNMFDEAERRGDHLQISTLSQLMGLPIVPTVFTSGRGVEQLFRTVIDIYEGNAPSSDTIFPARHIHINHGHEIEHGIEEIQSYLKSEENVRQRYSTRYLAIKLLEHDKSAEAFVGKFPSASKIFAARDEAARRVQEETLNDSETAIMDAKYGFIHGALEEAGYEMGIAHDTYHLTHLFDRIITHKYLGFPLFILLLWLMFATTFSLGQFPMDWIDAGVAWIGEKLGQIMPAGPLRDMLIDGVIGGVGAVIIFLPQILILYLFISFMEDSGYMARAAFIMDRLMHKMGLHGKSFIPLIMGFGCNVPAVMATRTIESRRSRLITMLILPLMSCSARLPIYIMIIGTFFATKYQSMVMILIYTIGIFMAILMSRLFSRYLVKGEDTPFVMELPPYRFPTAKAIGRHTWEKGKQYLKKMGGIILVASIVVWALGYFPHNPSLTPAEQKEQSYIGRMGKTIEPAFTLQGFNWKLDISLIAGVGAKEIVASSIGVLYSNDDSFGDDDSFSTDTGKYELLRQQMQSEGITPLVAFSYLLFVLLYFPCLATIVAIRHESGSWRWALFAAGYTTLLAWTVSALVTQIGLLIL